MKKLGYYHIRGVYPDERTFYAIVFCDNDTDAMAIAQGLRKVTTIREISVVDEMTGKRVFYDRLRIQTI